MFNKYFTTILPIIFAPLLLQGCQQTAERSVEQVVWVAPQQVNCIVDRTAKCYQILTDEPRAQWQLYNGTLTGVALDGVNFQQATISYQKSLVASPQRDNLKINKINSTQRQVLLSNSALKSNRTWQLKSLFSFDKLPDIKHQQHPFLTLSASGVSGFSGCNRFFSDNVSLFESNVAQQSLFEIGSVATTRGLCQYPLNQELERTLFLMLGVSNRVLVKWPLLSFYQGDTTVAQFVASDWH